MLEGKEVWSATTNIYVMIYFNLINADDPAAFDMMVSIKVMVQLGTHDNLTRCFYKNLVKRGCE